MDRLIQLSYARHKNMATVVFLTGVLLLASVGAGSGAQPHSHEHAWNLAVHGSKHWMIWPQARSFYTATPASTFFEKVWPWIDFELLAS